MYIYSMDSVHITLEIMCPFCGQPHFVTCRRDGFDQWYEEGELIQNAMPELSTTEREQLISGICPACQKKIFG